MGSISILGTRSKRGNATKILRERNDLREGWQNADWVLNFTDQKMNKIIIFQRMNFPP